MKLCRVLAGWCRKSSGGAHCSGFQPATDHSVCRTHVLFRFLRAAPALLALVALLSLAGLGCEAVQEQISPSTPTSPPPTATSAPSPQATPTTDAGPTQAASPSPEGTPTDIGLVLPVTIREVPASLPEYDRSSWRHWSDDDKDCQNARQEVLIAESTVAVTYESEEQCRVSSGLWYGPYTGEMVDDPGSLDVDHMVPLENAHRSGGWSWDSERKRDFANFMGYDNHLIATTSSANRSKGSKGPEAWRPPLEAYWCVYATDWVTIKNRWELTVTEAEYLALAEMLATCETTVLLQPREGTPPAPPTPTVAPTPTIPPSLPTDLRYDPFGPDRNCGDFDTYEEALAFFLAAGGPDADPHKLDLNDDGEPCESLPGGPSASDFSPIPQDSTALTRERGMPSPAQPSGCAATDPPDDVSGHSTTAGLGHSTSPDCPTVPPQIAQVAQPSPIAATPTPTPRALPTATPTPNPPPTPAQTTTPSPAEANVNCSDFTVWLDAQYFFLSHGGPINDPYGLDGNGDGFACQSLPGAPQDSSTPTPTPTTVPVATLQATPVLPAYAGLPFNPAGADRNCGDFASWWDAQNFFLAAGGPGIDPHGLDRNGDGTACESLLGAPKDDPPQIVVEYEAAPDNDGFQDRNCSDFSTWREAQDFFESEGGPAEDPHRLDGNKDGVACQSLPGAP